jgi:glycosyltransferase involved in cell wall biosynthesis
LINQNNKGLTVSLNRAIKISKGSIIARQDADDISHKERFTKQINVFRNNKNIVLCGTFAYLINEKNDIIKLVTNLPIEDNKIKNQLIYQNCFIHSSTMYRSSVIKKIGLYNKSYKYAQDYECWSRMMSEGIFLNIPKKLISIRVHNNSITFKNVKEQTYSAIQIALNNYGKILKKNKCEIDSLKKVFYFLNSKNLNKRLKINFFDLNLKEIFILIRFPKKLLKVILLKFF